MPRWLIPWLLPLGMLIAVPLLAFSTPIIAAGLFLILGFIGVPLAYRTYQANRPQRPPDDRREWPRWLR